MKTLLNYFWFACILTLTGCKKQTTTTPSANTPPPTIACSAIGTVQDTVFDNYGVKWYIVATTNPYNILNVALKRSAIMTGGLAIAYPQLHNGSGCAESPTFSVSPGGSTYTITAGPFPQSTIDTASTITILPITVNGTDFYLRDSKLNK
ncbi:MAG: hypothetical protein ACXVC6_07115 [Bacteroidia bacterium]